METKALQNLSLGELDPAETEEMLELRNQIFTPISRSKWDAMGCTAVVAKSGKQTLGAIPLQFRDYRIAPKTSVPVAFENAVGVIKEARSLGLGSAMLAKAAEFLHDRVDALCVYRSAETSAGYRFYRKTGHGDICYLSQYVLENPRGENNAVEVLGWQEAPALERQLLAIFNRKYQGYGGRWERARGYYQRIIASHVHGNDDCRLFLLRRQKQVRAYAITNPHAFREARHYLYDFAASRPSDAAAVFAKIKYIAARDGIPAGVFCNREHPLRELLLEEGFTPGRQTRHLMALVLRPERIFAQLAKKSFLLRELQLKAVTPHREMFLNNPRRPKARATIYLKESYFSRLMFRRLDLAAALEMDLLRMTPLAKRFEQALARVFTFSPWAVFDLDYA